MMSTSNFGQEAQECSLSSGHPTGSDISFSGFDWITSTTFDTLTDDAMLYIFSFLSLKDLLQACRVCQRWRSVALWKELWRNAVVSFSDADINPESVYYHCLRIAPFLKELDLHVGVTVTKNKVPNFLEAKAKWAEVMSEVFRHHHVEVRILRISRDVFISPAPDFKRLLRCFSGHLQELDLRFILIEWTDGQPTVKLDNFPNLKAITLDAFSSRIIEVDAASCPKLVEVTLQDAADESFEELLENNATLRNLRGQLKRLVFPLFAKSWRLVKLSKNMFSYFSRLESLSLTIPIFLHFEWSREGDIVNLEIIFKALHSGFFWIIQRFTEISILNHLTENTEPFIAVKNLTLRFFYADEHVESTLKRIPEVQKLHIIQYCSESYHKSSNGHELYTSISNYVTSSKPEDIHLEGCSAFIEQGKEFLTKVLSNNQIKYRHSLSKICEHSTV